MHPLLFIDPEDEAELDLLRRRDAIHEAWRAWHVHSCEERHGGHRWTLFLDWPDDGDGRISITCDHCPATFGWDVVPDGEDLVYAEGDGIEVSGGKHNSETALWAPITFEVVYSQSWTDCGWEYDVEVYAELSEPFRQINVMADGRGQTFHADNPEDAAEFAADFGAEPLNMAVWPWPDYLSG